MCSATVPIEASGRNGSGQHGLTESQATQGCRVKATKGMKRIAFVANTLNCCIQKTEVKVSIVADQDSALAI